MEREQEALPTVTKCVTAAGRVLPHPRVLKPHVAEIKLGLKSNFGSPTASGAEHLKAGM